MWWRLWQHRRQAQNKIPPLQRCLPDNRRQSTLIQTTGDRPASTRPSEPLSDTAQPLSAWCVALPRLTRRGRFGHAAKMPFFGSKKGKAPKGSGKKARVRRLGCWAAALECPLPPFFSSTYLSSRRSMWRAHDRVARPCIARARGHLRLVPGAAPAPPRPRNSCANNQRRRRRQRGHAPS